MDRVDSSKTLVPAYYTIWSHVPEDCYLVIHSHGILKSHCKMGSIILRNENKSQVFKCKVLRKIF